MREETLISVEFIPPRTRDMNSEVVNTWYPSSLMMWERIFSIDCIPWPAAPANTIDTCSLMVFSLFIFFLCSQALFIPNFHILLSVVAEIVKVKSTGKEHRC